MNNKRKPLYQEVAEKLIEQLENGTSPFHLPWSNVNLTPFNPITGRSYNGMNRFWMFLQNQMDPRWMTYKQAQSQGWAVKKGERGTTINVVKTHKEVIKKDHNGTPLLDENNKPIKLFIKLDQPYIRSAVVFNASQIEGIPKLEIEGPTQNWNDKERIEELIRNTRVEIYHKGNEAYYNPNRDYISMPHKNRFFSPEGYYSTLLHELAHWTGHPTRLNRPLNTKFGSEDYAREELRAEIASLLLAGEFGVKKELGQHAAYIEGWIKLLKNNPLEIYLASNEAHKISSYIKKYDRSITIELQVIKDNQQSRRLDNIQESKTVKLSPIQLIENNREKATPVNIHSALNLFSKIQEVRKNEQESSRRPRR